MNAPLTPRPRDVEIDQLDRLDELVAGGAKSMHGWHFQSVDLRGRSEVLVSLHAPGAIFMGCRFATGVEDLLRSRGALIFPALPHVPFNAYRGRLYSGAELFDGIRGGEYERVPDARIYQWSLQTGPALHSTLASAIHDHAITDALDEFLSRRQAPVVGVMGGHAAARGSEQFAQAARLGRALTRAGFFVATGGGPGAMEAANLGAYLSAYDAGTLDRALLTLAAVPSFRPSVTEWARAAFDVVDAHPDGAASLGIPTWFYGHEPPNVFASSIAKYFTNALREAILLQRSRGGIVFLPGAAGTVQEVFQDACENYYAADGAISPMVLVGRKYWEVEVPVMPLLKTLAQGRAMEDFVFIVDTVEEACEVLGSHHG
ncbi:putative Rossmann-fold nucleotide-binding protein [Arthrobacter stackebrandtii]|uniref:Rossmann-fold nucleotide-binding protein n=1 Tax=Arthrobacter stackebrandtii TaxID=272161 RepID=A0ABS4YSU3_9MICC|nr:putative Rossmann-fold nucleotide-binding protein [Arthrobacter stackebrandtii]PYG99107.1 Rossmann fold nucleotide-binding protein [Arthrobacter stackebrandtii]